MRFVARSVVVLAMLGCKDHQPAPQAEPAKPAAAKPARAQPSLPRQRVEGPGVITVTKVAATITYLEKDLQLDGNSLGKIKNGIIDREKLDALTRSLEAAGASSDPIGIAVEPTLPYLRLSELLFNLKAAGLRNLALLTGVGTNAVPLELRDADQVGSGVRPVVTVRGGAVILWSSSGEEGTMHKPRVATTNLAELTRALTEIVKRRWPDGLRPAEDRTIVIQMSGNERAEKLLQVIAAVRGDEQLELFPHVYLVGGG